MPPPPPRKPAAVPAKTEVKTALTPAKKPGERFIGNDSATMMSDETFEEFEARMRAEQEVDGFSDDEQGLEDEAAGDEAAGDEEQDEQDEAPQDDEEEEDDAPPQKKGPGGRPLDRFGVEWDYVSHEGMGFNDEDDEDALTRSEERRVGKECRRLCRSRWSPYH
jgi:hypothetical protein